MPVGFLLFHLVNLTSRLIFPIRYEDVFETSFSTSKGIPHGNAPRIYQRKTVSPRIM
jgi:hypothetical protein